jgi:hypothetical protein
VRTKRTKIIFVVLFSVASIVAILAIRNDNDEPRYNGKRLSQWLTLYRLDVYGQKTPEFTQAEEAVRRIGTNALPYFMKWIRYEPPAWRQRVMRYVPTRVGDNETFQNWIEGGDERRASLASLGLGILGTNALSVLPELTTRMNDSSAPKTSRRAIFALASMGESAVPVLQEALQDRNQTNRSRIVYSFRLMAFERGTNVILPYLIESLTNDDRFVRTAATNVITSLAPDVFTNALKP